MPDLPTFRELVGADAAAPLERKVQEATEWIERAHAIEKAAGELRDAAYDLEQQWTITPSTVVNELMQRVFDARAALDAAIGRKP